MDKPRETGHEIEIWRAPGHGTGEDQEQEQEQVYEGRVQDPEPDVGEDDLVRAYTSEKLRTLLRTLSPYVDGTFGTVSTKHAQVFMSAIRELNRLWSASYVRPPEPPPEPDEVEEEQVRIEAARQVREQVLSQLEQLRSRAR